MGWSFLVALGGSGGWNREEWGEWEGGRGGEGGGGRGAAAAGAAAPALARPRRLFSLAAVASVGVPIWGSGSGGSPTTQMFQAWSRGPCGLGKLRLGEEEGTRDAGVGGRTHKLWTGAWFCQLCSE